MDPSIDLRINNNPSDPPLAAKDRKAVIIIISSVFLLLVIYPSIISVGIICSALGYAAILYYDSYIDKLLLLLRNHCGINLQSSKRRRDESTGSKPAVLLDPLTHLHLQDEQEKEKRTGECQVCTRKNCQRDAECRSGRNSPKKSSKSPEKFTPTPYQPPKLDDLKIDPRLNTSIGRFCSRVFDHYVSTEWAPYLTRKQLKLSMKQLFINLGTRFNNRLQRNPKWVTELSIQKLIPCAIHYLERIQGGMKAEVELIFPEEQQNHQRLRVRQLCRIVLQGAVINEDEKNCKLWMELCESVLSDGVFWNVFGLGRDQIPELVADYVKKHIINRTGINGPNTNTSQYYSASISNSNESISVPEIRGYDEVDSKFQPITTSKDEEKVPFLLNSFLEPKDSMEQADPIVSRWKPTLKDIIEETELLYPLIQYLKHVGGQKALAYLQAVLDDSPDAKDYCWRILEIEYLPGFCRSNYFHESLGLSRVEQGLEVKMDSSPGSSRRTKGHLRSSSYGSKSNQAISDLLKMEGGIVDGLPLYSSIDSTDRTGTSGYSSSSYNSGNFQSPSAAGSSSAGETETDSFGFSLFGIHRKKTTVEDVIQKFIKSCTENHNSSSHNQSPSSMDGISITSPSSDKSQNKPNRVGIYANDFKEEHHPEVLKRTLVQCKDQCDIFVALCDILTSTITLNWWLGPVISSWLRFLTPFLEPFFISKLSSTLDEFLSLELCIKCIDLITNAFVSSNSSEDIPAVGVQIYNSSYSSKTKAKAKHKTKTNNSSQSISSSGSVSPLEESQQNNITSPTTKKQSFSSESESEITTEKKKNKEQRESNETLIEKAFHMIMANVLDINKVSDALSTNRDFLFLMFIDALDILVEELFGEEYDRQMMMTLNPSDSDSLHSHNINIINDCKDNMSQN